MTSIKSNYVLTVHSSVLQDLPPVHKGVYLWLETDDAFGHRKARYFVEFTRRVNKPMGFVKWFLRLKVPGGNS